jgi:DME family drug/metabolite transporter
VGSERLRGYVLVLLAAVLWATVGLFYKGLAGQGLPLLTIVFFRASVAALVLFLYLYLRSGAWPALARRDLPFFLTFGLFGVAAFYAVYVYAIDLAGVGVASVLMYTAPAWVAVLGVALFHERLSCLRTFSVALAVSGCALVGRVFDLVSSGLRPTGVVAGLGAGLTYGLYIVFSKYAQRRYSSQVALAYGLGFGALFLVPAQSPAVVLSAVTTPGTLFWLAMLGLVPTLGAGLAFNMGLRLVPASSASIVATLEPAIATLLGWAFLSERLAHSQIIGAGLILVAVILLQREERPERS